MSSARFPGKMLSLISGFPLIEYIYRRCRLSAMNNIIMATSDDASDDVLYSFCIKRNIPVMRAELHNVLRRYIRAAELMHAQYTIRVCGDTPFVDISLVDILLKTLINEKRDYVSFNTNTCAAGFYSEAVTLEALKKTEASTTAKENLEHVTKFIIEHPELFSTKFIDTDLNPDFVKATRLTIDYPEDIQTANILLEDLTDKFSFSSRDILEAVRRKNLK